MKASWMAAVAFCILGGGQTATAASMSFEFDATFTGSQCHAPYGDECEDGQNYYDHLTAGDQGTGSLSFDLVTEGLKEGQYDVTNISCTLFNALCSFYFLYEYFEPAKGYVTLGVDPRTYFEFDGDGGTAGFEDGVDYWYTASFELSNLMVNGQNRAADAGINLVSMPVPPALPLLGGGLLLLGAMQRRPGRK